MYDVMASVFAPYLPNLDLHKLIKARTLLC